MSYADWREKLGEAHDPALFPLGYQDHLIATGQGRFWETGAGAIVTQLVTYPSGALVCKTYAGAGDLAALLDELKPAIEAWAKAQGCSHCMIEGRDGWRRTHPDYRHYQTVLLKEL